MEEEWEHYFLLLQQIEAALTTNPTNEECLMLKVVLEEAIELTRDLMKTQLLERKGSEGAASSSVGVDATEKLLAAEQPWAEEPCNKRFDQFAAVETPPKQLFDGENELPEFTRQEKQPICEEMEAWKYNETEQKWKSEYDNILAEKEKALDVLKRKLSEAENKIVELSNFADIHGNCSSLLQDKDTALMSLQEQIADKEKLIHCSEEAITLMQEELNKAKNKVMELVEVTEMNVVRIAALKKEEESQVASQNEWEEKCSELNVVLKEKDKTIVLLQEILIVTKNDLEDVLELAEYYSACVKKLKEEQETVFIHQASNETELKEVKEKLRTLTDVLKEKEQKISILEEKLIRTENKMKNIQISYAEMLKEKDESFSSLRQQIAETEQHLEEIKATYLKLAEDFQEQEASTALLQRDLIKPHNEISEAAKVKQLHQECECRIEENQETIMLLHELLTNKEKSIVEVTQKYLETVDALKKSKDDCTLLQEKLNNAEHELKALVQLKPKHAVLMDELEQKEEVNLSMQISLSEMEQKNALLIQSVKEKEDALTLLQNKLSLAELSTKDAAEIKQIHSMCTIALNKKEESLLSYKKKLADNEIYIAETTEKMSKLSKECTEKDERIASLEKKLHEASVTGNKLCEEEKNKAEVMLDALNKKDKYISSLEENLAANKILLEKITKQCSTLTDTLREKEESLAVLQLKMHKSRLEIEEGKELKHIHSECLLKLKAKEELLLYLEQKLAANEIFTVETVQNCSKLTKAFTDIEERIRELEQKVFALLEKRLQDSHSELDKEGIHSRCIKSLREKDELLSHLERQIKANQASEAERVENYSRLANVIRGMEDSVRALKEKLDEAENREKQMESKLSTYVAALKEKEDIIVSLEEKLHNSQSKITEEIRAKCIQSAREADELISDLERKATANEISVRDIMQNCSILAGTLRGTQEYVNALEQELCKAQNCERQMDLEIQALKKQCKDMTKEIVLFTELKTYHDECTGILKEKEELVSSLQEKLTNSNKHSVILEEKLDKISREKEEGLMFIQEMKNEIEKKVMEVERLKKVNEINAQALKQETENILTLERKLCDKEMFVKELQETITSLKEKIRATEKETLSRKCSKCSEQKESSQAGQVAEALEVKPVQEEGHPASKRRGTKKKQRESQQTGCSAGIKECLMRNYRPIHGSDDEDEDKMLPEDSHRSVNRPRKERAVPQSQPTRRSERISKQPKKSYREPESSDAS